MFNRFCQLNPCFLEQEERFEIDVATLQSVQNTLNQLPPFEHRQNQTLNHTQHSHHPRSPEPYHQHANNLINAKSQPKFILVTSQQKEKENNPHHHRPSHCSPPFQHLEHSLHNKRQPFSNTINIKSRDCMADYDMKRSVLSPQTQKIHPPEQNYLNWTVYHGHKRQRQTYHTLSNESMVSMKQYNRLAAINYNLIKMIQQDYSPLKQTCHKLNQEQKQRERLIENLQAKIKALKKQINSHSENTSYNFY